LKYIARKKNKKIVDNKINSVYSVYIRLKMEDKMKRINITFPNELWDRARIKFKKLAVHKPDPYGFSSYLQELVKKDLDKPKIIEKNFDKEN
jgi:hypothetical protein